MSVVDSELLSLSFHNFVPSESDVRGAMPLLELNLKFLPTSKPFSIKHLESLTVFVHSLRLQHHFRNSDAFILGPFKLYVHNTTCHDSYKLEEFLGVLKRFIVRLEMTGLR